MKEIVVYYCPKCDCEDIDIYPFVNKSKSKIERVSIDEMEKRFKNTKTTYDMHLIEHKTARCRACGYEKTFACN